MVVIGIMSGSSLDGLDIAACDFELQEKSPLTCSWSILASKTFSFPEDLRKRLSIAHQLGALPFSQLDIDLGIWVGNTVLAFLDELKETPEAIAWHGHTVFHYPDKKLSVQIGSGIAISVISGLDVIYQFRQADVIAGGEGAPLAPLVDKYLFPGYNYYLNLGGIGNISFYDRSEIIRSFDVCPVNQILNRLSEQKGLDYDKDGHLAQQGKKRVELSQQLDEWDYYGKEYPKSLDNQQIANHLWPVVDRFPGSAQDKLNTFCKHIAEKVSSSVDHAPRKRHGKMLVTGGGAYNTFLMSCIRNELKSKHITVELPGKIIIDFKEALLMAFMGYLWKNKIPNVLNEVTGAESAYVSGVCHPGRSGG